MTPEARTEESQQPPAAPQGEYLDVTTAAPPTPRSSLSELLGMVMEAGPREDYARQIVQAELERDAFAQDIKLASVFAQCGAFDDIKGSTAKQSIALAMAKIQLGRSWGLSPADSMRFVYFTNGKPAIETAIIAAKMRDAGFDWDIEWHEEAASGKCIGCTLWVKKWSDEKQDFVSILDRAGNPVKVSFTKKDADTAMIWEKGKQIPLSEKWNFRSWPRDMYFARCISRVHKYHASNVMRGAVSREEVEDVASSVRDDVDMTGVRTGTRADQARIAEEKIAEMEAARAAKGKAPGETTADRDARIEKQITEQSEQAERTAAAEANEREDAEYGPGGPDAELKAQSNLNTPAPPRTRPVFGKGRNA